MLAHEFKLEIETRQLCYVIKKMTVNNMPICIRIALFTRRFRSSFFALKCFESVQLGKWNLKFEKKNFLSIRNVKPKPKEVFFKVYIPITTKNSVHLYKTSSPV